MIPARLLLLTTALLAALGLLAAFLAPLAVVWTIAALALAAVALLDLALALFARPPEVERSIPNSMSLACWTGVSLTLRRHGGRQTAKLRLFDHHPQSFQTEGLPGSLDVRPRRYAVFEYRVRPTERGRFEFAGVDLQIASPARLWWRRRFLPLADSVRVYPNYATISKLLAYEVSSQLSLAGLRLRRRRGEGTEFEQLRDYREGDSMRAIDWKATARVKRLIAREYQDERDQQIVFMLDAGRRMMAKDGELSHFDQALNAMFLLSYVALRQGDAVGVMTLGSRRRWMPPRKGMDAINGLLNHVYEVQPQPVEIDYLGAATELATRQRRRSMIVCLTNVREEDTEDLKAASDLLGRRHLVMLASLRERVLDDITLADVAGFGAAVTLAATHAYLEARREAQNLLRARGVLVEDCLSEDLPAAITNRYLAIKRAGVL